MIAAAALGGLSSYVSAWCVEMKDGWLGNRGGLTRGVPRAGSALKPAGATNPEMDRARRGTARSMDVMRSTNLVVFHAGWFGDCCDSCHSFNVWRVSGCLPVVDAGLLRVLVDIVGSRVGPQTLDVRFDIG